jgi:hypothetical protein
MTKTAHGYLFISARVTDGTKSLICLQADYIDQKLPNEWG